MMQVSKKIPFEDPDTLNIVRAVYAASNLIILGIYLYIQSLINKKKGEQILVSQEPVDGAASATPLD